MRGMILLYILFLNIHIIYTYTIIQNNNSTAYGQLTVPEAPNIFEIKNITDISAHVIWSAPMSPVNITQYELEAKVVHTYSKEINVNSPKWTFSNNIFRSEISNLQPGTKYNVSIRAISLHGKGQEKSQIIETEIGEPDQSPKELKVLDKDDTTMTVKISPVENNNGPVSFYRIVVMNINQMQVFEQNLLHSYEEAMRDGPSYYITADVNPEDINTNFIIGDGKTYNKYYNAPLKSDSRYYAFVGIVSKLNGVTKLRFPEIAVRQSSFTNLNSQGTGLVVGLAVAVAIASVLLIMGVVVLVLVRHRFHRNRRQRLSDNQELCVQGPMIQVANQGYIPDDESERTNYYDELKRNIWNIPRDSLQINPSATGDSFLGFGLFGHIVKATVQKPNKKTPENVACYIITDGDLNPQNKRLMLRKLDVLIKAGTHENLAGLVGTCENPENVYIILEHSSLVLKDMLLNNRHTTHNGKFTNITEIEVLDILIGIAEGMNHLERKNLIHEKLCARNIFIFDGVVPKITGHGISHYNSNNVALDLSRWTAPEVLNGKPFIIKSDVWSFGCLIWEVCSLGGTPYNNLDAERFSYEVCRGVRLPKFSYISEEFYQIMISCWQNDPGERPTFYEISQQLIYFRNTLSMYTHLNFELTPDFTFENYVAAMEVAQDVCHRSKRNYS